MATGKRHGRRPKGTRLFLVIGLIGFFVAATGVVTRRIFGISQAKTLRALQLQREAVEAARVKLEVEIRDASNRSRLGPIAERRLNMYVPADSQVIILPRETRPNP
jgi:cell division protein FtsL